MAKITLNNIRPLVSKISDELMPGVRRTPNCKDRYQAWLSINGTQEYLGSFGSNLEAGIAYLETKIKRDSDYLVKFQENLARDKNKLTRLKSNLSDSRKAA